MGRSVCGLSHHLGGRLVPPTECRPSARGIRDHLEMDLPRVCDRDVHYRGSGCADSGDDLGPAPAATSHVSAGVDWYDASCAPPRGLGGATRVARCRCPVPCVTCWPLVLAV